MTYLRDYHVHSVYSDGTDKIEDIIKQAIKKGMTEIGISDHSYTSFDTSYCISKENIHRYISEIDLLKEKYKDRIKIFCGIEQDFYSDFSADIFDYSIGSVHYVKIKNTYVPVDENTDIINDAVNKYFNNDIYSFVELYFNTVSQVIEKTNCSIIGHFDLISKFNGNGRLFDEKSERYISAWKKAVDNLIKYNIPFEINTSPLYKQLKKDAYPDNDIRQYIKNKGGKFALSSDSHSLSCLCRCFEDFSGITENETPFNIS